MNVVHLCDCMDIMRKMPDKSVDLCIVDPPYGININMNIGLKKGQIKKREQKNWDNSIPDNKYFEELFRISKNTIIWGGNYFPLPPSRNFIVWDKGPTMYGRSFAECELAWTNINDSARIYKLSPIDIDRIHPTQKPVALYKWLLKNYAKPGDKIFDSHVGSGSIRIACHDMGFDFEGCEIDKDYWEAQEKRYNSYVAQPDLFDPRETYKRSIESRDLFEN